MNTALYYPMGICTYISTALNTVRKMYVKPQDLKTFPFSKGTVVHFSLMLFFHTH